MSRRRGSSSRSRQAHREDKPVDKGTSTSLGKFPEWDERTLYFAPEFHISEWVRIGMAGDRVRCHDSGNGAIGSLYDLHFRDNNELRELRDSYGLTPLLQATRAMYSIVLIRSLV